MLCTHGELCLCNQETIVGWKMTVIGDVQTARTVAQEYQLQEYLLQPSSGYKNKIPCARSNSFIRNPGKYLPKYTVLTQQSKKSS
jgi:hypothetical protein